MRASSSDRPGDGSRSGGGRSPRNGYGGGPRAARSWCPPRTAPGRPLLRTVSPARSRVADRLGDALDLPVHLANDEETERFHPRLSTARTRRATALSIRFSPEAPCVFRRAAPCVMMTLSISSILHSAAQQRAREPPGLYLHLREGRGDRVERPGARWIHRIRPSGTPENGRIRKVRTGRFHSADRRQRPTQAQMVYPQRDSIIRSRQRKLRYTGTSCAQALEGLVGTKRS